MVEIVHCFGVASSEHIADLLGEVSPQQVRRRLQLLFHAGYLNRPWDVLLESGPEPMLYSLGSAGARLLGVPRKKMPRPSSLERRLTVAAVLASLECSCRARGDMRVVPFREISCGLRLPAVAVNSLSASWPVDLPETGVVRLTPAAIFGLSSRDRSGVTDTRYFLLEVDQGTMPVVRRRPGWPSVYRKLLLYHATAARGLHEKLLGLHSFRVLVVTRSPRGRRIETMLRAIQGLKTFREIFLFADREAVVAAGPLECEWVDGKGQRVTLTD